MARGMIGMGGSGKAGLGAATWFLAAAHALRSTSRACHPAVETGELDFSMLGIAICGYIDVGVGFLEPRGGVRRYGRGGCVSALRFAGRPVQVMHGRAARYTLYKSRNTLAV